jgi:hypothetical protein
VRWSPSVFDYVTITGRLSLFDLLCAFPCCLHFIPVSPPFDTRPRSFLEVAMFCLGAVVFEWNDGWRNHKLLSGNMKFRTMFPGFFWGAAAFGVYLGYSKFAQVIGCCELRPVRWSQSVVMFLSCCLRVSASLETRRMIMVMGTATAMGTATIMVRPMVTAINRCEISGVQQVSGHL